MTGIYAIVHRDSGRRYVGSSIDIRRRIRDHNRELRSSKHCNPYLQACWSKYGPEAFDFIVLEETSRDDLLSKEQAHLDSSSERSLNICSKAYALPEWTEDRRKKQTSALVGHPTSDATKLKISEANKGRKPSPDAIAAARLIHLGSNASDETKRKMSLSRIGKKLPPWTPERRKAFSKSRQGKKLSEEHKAKIGNASRGRKQSPEWIAKRTAYNFGNKYWMLRRKQVTDITA